MKISLFRCNSVWWILSLQLFFIKVSSGSHYLEVDISILSSEKLCFDKCVIPYKLVLSKEVNDIETLNEDMMVYGELTVVSNKYNDSYFSEITVIRLPKAIRKSKEPVHLELTILDLPKHIEDYIDVNVTSLLYKRRQMKVHSMLKSTTKLLMTVTRKHELERHTIYMDSSNSGCICKKGKCSCCSHVNIPVVGLDHNTCFNFTYNKNKKNLILTMEIEKEVIIKKIEDIMSPTKHYRYIEALNKHVYGDIQMYNINISRRMMYFCTELLMRRFQIRVVKEKIGCFNIFI